VRQRLDASGQVAAVNDYRPFGSPLDGGGGDPYGYTGEWWEDDAGLLFLRARYYDPQLGIFLSPDPVPGTHLYLYVGANPINLVDPSGRDGTPPPPRPPTPPSPFTPIGTPVPTPVGTPVPTPVPQPRTEWDEINKLIRQYRYLHTENYGWFDLGHAHPKNRLYNNIMAKAGTGGEVEVGGTVVHPFEFYAYYQIEKLDNDQIEGVALGIFQDFSHREERWQGGFPLHSGSGTSFAIEDFPSNYIGFLAAFRNQGEATKYDSAKLILDYLGPAEWTNESPPHSDNPPFTCVGTIGCAGAYQRYAEEVKNYEFTPRIEIAPSNYANIAWPCDELVIQPIRSGPDTWHFLREEHNRHILTYLEAIWDRIKP
jgi:RHS repeat-associated protein